MISKKLKERIITERLKTRISYRELGAKYDLKYQTVHQWVQDYQGKVRNRKSEKKVKPKLLTSEAQMPVDVPTLQEELRKARLMNEVLNEIIDVAEEDLNIPIRKKFGTK